MNRGLRRPPHVNLPETPYFVSTRTYQSKPVFQGQCGEAAVSELHRIRERYELLLLAYVFMPDHAHFVLVPLGERSLSQTMRLVKGAVARRVNEIRGVSGHVWQEGFYDKIAHTREQLNTFIEYIHNNPVEARLTDFAAAYPYSSASGTCMADYATFFSEART